MKMRLFLYSLVGWMLAVTGSVAQPVPHVRLAGVPTDVMIGGYFSFKIYFSNAGNQIGYVPYIDLDVASVGADGMILDTTSCNMGFTCDGLFVVPPSGFSGDDRDTSYDTPPFSGGFYNYDSYPCNPNNNGYADHPLANFGLPPIITCPGHSWSIIKLRPGSVQPGSPELFVDVTIKVSELADRWDGTPATALRVQARGGFAYGTSAQADQTPAVLDPANSQSPCQYPLPIPNPAWTANAEVHPILFSVAKDFFGREGETATGPNSPVFFGLIVDVATGQNITDLNIEDLLPNNLMFDRIEKVVPMPFKMGAPIFYTGGTLAGFTPNLLNGGVCGGANIDYTLIHSPVFTAVDNYLQLQLCHDVLGVPGPELAVVIQCHVPETDVFGNPVLDPADCFPRTSRNDVMAFGEWLPADCRDQIPPNSQNTIHVDSPHAYYDVVDRCVALQKTWLPGPPNTRLPGISTESFITYTLDFQVSDYRTLNDIEVVDYLSDGQELVPGTATLWVRDQFGSSPANVNVPALFNAGVDLLELPDQTPVCRDGTAFNNLTATKLTFKVSTLMATMNLNVPHGAGRLTGGHAITPTTVRAEGQIVFQVRVKDTFDHLQGVRPGDLFVDKSDLLDNCVAIFGKVLDNSTLVPNGCIATDNSQVQIPIQGTGLSKSVYAIRPFGGTPVINPPASMRVGPGDEVTFRLSMLLPSSDGENLVIRDWLSTPIFKLDEPGGSGSSPWPATASGLPSWPAPLVPGTASAGAADTFNAWYSANFAPVTINAHYTANVENMLEFLYASFNDSGNQSRLNEIFYTLTVGAAVIGDGYNIVNTAQECEDNTFSTGTPFCSRATATLVLAEPRLRLTKGIVATDDNFAIFTRPDQGSLAILPPNSITCPRFSGAVMNSTYLADPFSQRFNSDIFSLAPNSLVTFMIVVENVGHGPRGAFDVTIRDALPACFSSPANLCVNDGTGAPLLYTGTLSDLLGLSGLVLDDFSAGAGSLAAFSPGSGLNVAVITFDAMYTPGPGDGCCVNQAELIHYSNVPGGDNFITNPLDSELVAQAADSALAGPPPVLTCAPDKSVICNPNFPWSFDAPTAQSTCCNDIVITVLSTLATGPCESTRTWQVIQCGHIDTCSQTVTITGDDTPPVITGSTPAITVECNAVPVGPATLPAYDSCDPGVTAATLNADQILLGNCPNRYTITRTWTATDACGNFTNATQIINVVDTTPPDMTPCPPDITVECTSDAGAEVTYACPTATDTCPGTVTVTCTPPPGPFPIGLTVVTCTAEDACGNTTTCTFNVTVLAHGPGQWTWARNGGIASEPASGKAVAVDPNGNVFVTGLYLGAMIFPGSAITLTVGDVFLAKYDAAGTLLWARSIVGAGNDLGNGVTVDEAGNAYVTGGFTGTGTFDTVPAHDLTSLGQRDIFVAKYDPSGTVLWTRREGGTGDDYGAGIVWTPVWSGGPDGKLFVTGYWGSDAYPEAFVLKVTDLSFTATVSAPVRSLSSPAGGSHFAWGRAVAVDNQGNPYVTGAYGGPRNTTFPGTPAGTLPPATPVGLPRLFVARFDRDNLALCTWQTHGGYAGTMAASLYSDGTGIAVDPSGSFCFVAAYFTGTANFGNSGSADIFVTNPKHSPAGQLNDFLIAKLRTADGTPVWAINGANNGGGDLDSNDEPHSLAVDPDGNPCVTGFLHPLSGTPYVNAGPTVLVASYDGITHALRWTRHATDGPNWPGSLENVGFGIAVGPLGCVHVTGAVKEDLQLPPLSPLNSITPIVTDMFVAKMCPLCCPPNPKLYHTYGGGFITLSWDGPCCHLESTGELGGTPVWVFVSNTSPVTLPLIGQQKFFRLVCP